MFRIRRGVIGRIFIGIFLVIVLGFGIFTVRQYGEQARRDQAIAALDKQEKSEDPTTVSSGDVSTATEKSTTNTETDTTQKLPDTGAATPVNGVMLGLMVYSVVLYVRSRSRLSVRALTY